MWCRQVRSQLSAYADGELGAAERRSVEEHLSRCEQCSREYTGLQTLVRLTAGIPAEEAPTSLHAGIMTRLAYADSPRCPQPARRPVPGMRLSVFNPWMWSAATGAAAVLVMGLVQQHTPPTPLPQAGPPAPQKETSAPRESAEAQPAPRQRTEQEAARPAATDPKDTPAVEPHAAEHGVAALATLPALPERASKLSTHPQVAKKTVDHPERSQPLTASAPTKTAPDSPSDPPAPATTPNPGIMAIMPDPPESDRVPGSGNPPELMTAVMDKDGATRMAGMPASGDMQGDEDEGVRGLRMFLEERNKTVPQPPLVNPSRMRKL
jgi:hypothetical protein